MMFQAVSMFCRRGVAYPLLILGILGGHVSAALVNAAAWLVDVDFDDIEVE